MRLNTIPGDGIHVDTACFFAELAANGCAAAPLAAAFPIPLTASASFVIPVGTPFQVDYTLLAATTAISATFDFFNTAHLSFILPDGMSITSLGGFSSPTAVPEPASIVLLGSGLAAIGGLGWRRRRQR